MGTGSFLEARVQEGGGVAKVQYPKLAWLTARLLRTFLEVSEEAHTAYGQTVIHCI